MRFLLDMGIAPATGEFVRKLGHDAVHLRDRGLQRLADDKIFSLAADEDRIIVSCDLDFTRIVAREGRKLPSLVLFRLETYTTAQINNWLEGICRDHAGALMEGAIVVVEPKRIRVRRLPITP